MTNWAFKFPVQILFCTGALQDIPKIATGKRRLALVTTAGFTKRGVTDRLRELIGPTLVAVVDNVKENPDLDQLDRETLSLRDAKPDMIIGLGGGSALDTAKILAAQLGGQNVTLSSQFRDGVTRSAAAALPTITVPTTAGTGAEVTPFATVWDHQHAKKYSLAGDDLFPRFALLDPELTLSLPVDVTIATGLDAVSQALESIWNRRANAISSAWALQSLRLSIPTLPDLVIRPGDLSLRSKMLEASLLAGMAISQTRTALAHSMSYPITAHFGVAHGIACSFTLPAILAFNAGVDDGRLASASRALGFASVEGLSGELKKMLAKLGLASILARHVADLSELDKYVSEMITPNRADNNLRDTSYDDIRTILAQTRKILAG